MQTRYIKNMPALFIAFWFSIFSTSPATAGEFEFVSVMEVPSIIHYVESGGCWTTEEDEGLFRVIVTAAGVEHVRHKMFLQWLVTNPETQSYKIFRTPELVQINQTTAIFSEIDVSFTDINSYQINLTATRRDKSIDNYQITVTRDGTHSIATQRR